MHVRLAVLLLLTSLVYGQDKGAIELSGTAVNTTESNNPTAAPIRIVLDKGDCKLTVSPPLVGSGACKVRSFDEKSGSIEIISIGSPEIVWTGTIKGNFVSGTYKIAAGAQAGLIYLAILRQPKPETAVPSPSVTPYVAPLRTGCVPTIETTIYGEFKGWDGETIFKLFNGEIWQQAEYDYTYFYEYNPEVTIYHTSDGCRMKVEGESDTILVKRLK